MKSGNLNFLEPSGPLHSWNGTVLPFLFTLWKNSVPCVRVEHKSSSDHTQFLGQSNVPISHGVKGCGGDVLVSNMLTLLVLLMGKAVRHFNHLCFTNGTSIFVWSVNMPDKDGKVILYGINIASVKWTRKRLALNKVLAYFEDSKRRSLRDSYVNLCVVSRFG